MASIRKSQRREIKKQILDNRKNFFLAVKGPEFYNKNVVQPELQAEINVFVRKQQDELAKIQLTNTRTLNAYTATMSSLDRIGQLNIDVDTKNEALKRDIDRKEKSTNTAERQVYYEFQQMDKLLYYNKIIRIAYLVVLILYAVISIYYVAGQYKKPKFWLFLIIAVAIPFALPIVTKFVLSHLKYL